MAGESSIKLIGSQDKIKPIDRQVLLRIDRDSTLCRRAFNLARIDEKKWSLRNQSQPKLLIFGDDKIKDSIHHVSLALELLKGAQQNLSIVHIILG
jgi:hypothetical protein